MARYIDADKLLENLKKQYGEDLGWQCTVNMSDVGMMIEDAPTADVVEVRHSRWENISGFDVCNICGTSPADWETKPNNPKGYPPYCHCCGAKMDGNNLSTIPTGSE